MLTMLTMSMETFEALIEAISKSSISDRPSNDQRDASTSKNIDIFEIFGMTCFLILAKLKFRP